MTFERRFLVDQETQSSDSATRRIELPEDGFLSGLELRTRITNGATAGEEAIVQALDRIEVIADGSDVLFSLEGFELHRWAWFWNKREPLGLRREGASAVQELNLPIPFGRALGDQAYALPLAQYRNVELRVQYSPTISATTFATGTVQFHVPMWWAPQNRPPANLAGWLRTTQLRAFTTAASGEEVLDLPQRYPLWDLQVYVRENTIDDSVDVTQLEIRTEQRRLNPYVGRWDDLQAMHEFVFGIDPWVWMELFRADNATIDTFCGATWAAQLQLVFDEAAAGDFPVFNIASAAGDRITLSGHTVEGSATYAATVLDTTRRQLYLRARGRGIGNAVHFPFASLQGPAYVLDTPNLTKPQLAITQGGAGGDCRVSARELVAA